jgi:hypothetical protein
MSQQPLDIRRIVPRPLNPPLRTTAGYAASEPELAWLMT